MKRGEYRIKSLYITFGFVANTKIKLADGRNETIFNIVKEFEQGKKNYVYSLNDNNEITVQPITDAFFTKKVNKYIRLTLDNNEIVECTLDHKFRLKDDTYKEAKDLTDKDSLAPLYYKTRNLNSHTSERKYEMVKMCYGWDYTHRIVARQYYGDRPSDCDTHHIDNDPLNNNPDNLMYKNTKQHWLDHNKEWKEKYKDEIREKTIERMFKENGLVTVHRKRMKEDKEYYDKVVKRLTDYTSSEEGRKKMSEATIRKFKEHPEMLDHLSEVAKEQWKDEELLKWRAEKTREQMSDPKMKERIRQGCRNTKLKKAADTIYKLKQDGLEINAENYNKTKPKRDCPKWTTLGEWVGGTDKIIEWHNSYNHRVIKKEIIEEETNVYDLTVPPYNNFALSAGVFVHNSAKNGRYSEFQAILPLRGK